MLKKTRLMDSRPAARDRFIRSYKTTARLAAVSQGSQAPVMSISPKLKLIANWPREQYRLVDFGAGRKLESFAGQLLDRSSPAAQDTPRRLPDAWSSAIVVEEGVAGDTAGLPADWQLQFQSLRLSLKLTPFGHVGMFPEQLCCWRWLMEQVVSREWSQPPEALNLFGYTGGSSLALASAGARVVHVDASAPAVKWARSNAAASQLAEHPIRWIVDDARKFVQRERRRGRHYDVIVLDPPSYGHGPTGKPWDIQQDLPALLQDVVGLFRNPDHATLLITGHSDDPGPGQIADLLLPFGMPDMECGRLRLVDESHRELDAGFFIRISRVPASTA
jgi:23S rRNA (cytosine1962-C5)-methyltransferase